MYQITSSTASSSWSTLSSALSSLSFKECKYCKGKYKWPVKSQNYREETKEYEATDKVTTKH